MKENMVAHTFEYPEEFRNLIIEMHRGKENLPFYKGYIAAHLGGPRSNLDQFLSNSYPEIVYHLGNIGSMRVLDFGCGTGASTAALAMNCKNVVAFDRDKKSIFICEKRLEEHKLRSRVTILCANDFQDVAEKAGTFDLIVINAVIEHIPTSINGLRRKQLRTLFDALNPGGSLYINATPNRLFPVDLHTTKLWWIPWTKPGSKWAYSKAVKRGRYVRLAEYSEGPLGLEESGSWGATFFEIKKYLNGKSYEILNCLPGHNKHLSYTRRRENTQRMLFDFIVYYFFSKWTKIPLTAVSAAIENLIIRKVR
jgi:2-polyprenyl-3-methyl-5-hydroxy-6-metoxy-1,4-benzoquinol methylase